MTTIADIMTHRPVAVNAAATVTEALEAMRDRGISSVLVSPPQGSTEYGIATMRDIIRKVVKEGIDPDSIRVGDIMTWRLITTRPSWTLRQAAELMAGANVRRLPVVEGTEIVGLVSDTDIFTALVPGREWEYARQVRKERALRRGAQTGTAKTVADLMSAPILTIGPSATVEDAVRKMVAAGISSLLVTEDGGGARGIVTKRDIVLKVAARELDPRAVTVDRIMSSPVRTIGAELTLEECSSRMASAGMRRFPVDRQGEVVGIISDSDILAAVSAHRWIGGRRGPTLAMAADVMRPPRGDRPPSSIGAVTPELSIWECAERLAQAGVHELSVVQDGRIIGVVSKADIVRAIEERGGLH